MEDVVIETSALCDILDKPALHARFLRAVLNKKTIRILVSLKTLDELFCLETWETFFSRALAFRALRQQLSERLQFAATHEVTLSYEITTRIRRTLLVDDEFKRGIRRTFDSDSELKRIHLEGRESFRDISRVKDAMLENDLKVQSLRHQIKGTDKEIMSAIKNFAMLSHDSWLLKIFLDEFGGKSAVGLAETIRRKRDRYPTFNLFCFLSELSILRAALPTDYGDPLAIDLATTRGDWYDTLVALSASYSDIFVVEDKGLRTRCELLRKNGLIKFRSMTIEEFLSQIQCKTSSP